MKQGKNVIPMTVPNIPSIPPIPKPMFDITQAIEKQCECGSDCFDKVFRVKTVSKLASGNMTNQDVTLEVLAYICHICRKELNLINK